MQKPCQKNSKKIQVLYLDDKIKSSRSIDVISYILKKKKPKKSLFYCWFRYSARTSQMEKLEKNSKISKINCFLS